jgi:SPP1 gp7 family putative phage head morphogenesis protein
MTLAASPRPGAPTVPRPLVGISGSGAAEPYHLQFLSAEERSTAVLMGFFQDARLELEDFIRSGDLTVSDATYYRKLIDETNRIASKVNAQGAEWTSSTIPEGYSAGWRQNSSVVVPQKALEALSRDTLSLITQTSDGIRQSVRQAISQGILQGLPADAVRQRIIGTGLTNIPHWPSVEYRAGVIARTETMRAYNAGNLAAVEENGARFVRWIASPDEAVCAICGPRNGDVFRVGGDAPGPDPYPNALPLPKLPAHPRCRCTIKAEYRDADGKVIGTPNAQEPALPPDAMGGRDAPILPPAKGDFAQATGGLKRDLDAYLSGSLDGSARQAWWRSLGRLDEDDLRMVAGHGLTNALGHAQTDAFLRLRYGIKFGKITGWSADLRLSLIRALERIREKNPGYVVDSTRYLHTIGERPIGAKRFGSNTLARAFGSGHVEGNLSAMKAFAGPNGRKLRGGADIDAAEEVWMHEIFHTIHNRYGAHFRYPNHGPIEGVDPLDFENEWRSIRGSSQGIAPDSGSIADEVARLRAKGAEWESKYPSISQPFTRQADELAEKAARGDVEFYPTSYAQSSHMEDFAESGMLYLLNPAKLREFSPNRYAFFRDKIFGGQEP